MGTPQNVWLAQGSGIIVQPVLRTNYDTDGHTLKHSSVVPWRLTGNLSEVMQPFGLEGPFTSSLCAVAMCLGKNRQQLHNYAALFLRDDLMVHRMRMNRRVTMRQGGAGMAAESLSISPEV